MAKDGGGLRTERLRLRPWQESDLKPFADLNADPVVMEHFPSVLSREQSDTVALRIQAAFSADGWGFWALEIAHGEGAGRFAGFTGLSVPSWTAPFTPCVEIGWRLPRWAWGRGYASEAAREALRFGFVELGLEEIVSFTTEANTRSRAVMERIGLARDAGGDFDHPNVPADDPHLRHVLYRLDAAVWSARHGS
jgi:RimJ/RimL family protein N-acetyltransferase